MKYVLALVLLFPLTGCFSDGEKFGPLPSDIAPLFGGGGGGGGAVPAPAQAPAQAPGTAAAKMLQDPEAMESNGSDYVWADDRQSAMNMCQRIAERNGWRLDDVDNGEGIALQTGRKRFTCYFTMFGAPRQ